MEKRKNVAVNSGETDQEYAERMMREYNEKADKEKELYFSDKNEDDQIPDPDLGYYELTETPKKSKSAKKKDSEEVKRKITIHITIDAYLKLTKARVLKKQAASDIINALIMKHL